MAFRYWNKRVIVFIILLAMVVGNYPSLANPNPEGVHVQAAAGFNGGDGTDQDPYQIATADQLNEVRNYLDSHFVLINDIDLSAYDENHSWQPIGSDAAAFSGHLDGGKFKIVNLYVDNTDSVEIGGLFGEAAASSSIRDLVLENVDVRGTESVGALVGHFYGDGMIENVTATGLVSGSGNWIGGVIGYNDGDTTISNVNFDGTVKGSGSVGGIIGFNYLSTLTHATFEGIVEGEGAVGGLVGFHFLSDISNGISLASVTGIVDVGGLVGRSQEGNVDSSYATGNVTGIEDNFTGEGHATENTGGLVGNNIEGTVSNSYARGNINGSEDVGGLVGENKEGSISSSYATGNVEGSEYIGGLSGRNYYGTISHSYAAGRVKGEIYVGGLSGDNFDSTISNSYATGQVNGNESVGGLVGYNLLYGIVKNSYSRGHVTGNVEVGGLVGTNEESDIIDSYYDTDTSGQADNKGIGLPSLSMKNNDTYVGWDFAGIWEQNKHNSGYPYLSAYQNFLTYVSNDKVQEDERSYSVSYTPNQSVTVDGNISKWTKPGFVLGGWNTESDGRGTAYSKGDTIGSSSNILLYANWVINNENLSGLRLSSGAKLSQPFDENSFSYNANVANSVSSIHVTPVTAKQISTVTVAINGGIAELVASGSASSELPLKVGVNTLNVVVTASDGVATKTYTVSVTRENSPIVVPPTPTPTPSPTPIPTATQAPKPFYIDEVNIEVIKSMVAKSNTAPIVSYKDVPANAQNAKAIVLATKLGIINGYEDGSFRANATITRAEFASLFVRALGLTSEGDYDFIDTKGHWAADPIATLKTIGIAKGYLDGTFKPNQTITRAEIVTMLSKVINMNFVKSTKFSDVRDHWAEAEIDTLSDMGIVKGTPDGLFKPNANATRTESLLMILRMLNASLGHTLDVE